MKIIGRDVYFFFYLELSLKKKRWKLESEKRKTIFEKFLLTKALMALLKYFADLWNKHLRVVGNNTIKCFSLTCCLKLKNSTSCEIGSD